MRRFDLTTTRVLSYRAKWWAYKRICRKVEAKNLEETVRKQIHIEYDQLLQEELLNGDVCNIFPGLGNIYIEGKYVQLKNKNGEMMIRQNHLKNHYFPIYDDEGNPVKQYEVAEFWSYRIRWVKPGYMFKKFKVETNPRYFRAKITQLIVADSPLLYKFKDNYKRIKRWYIN